MIAMIDGCASICVRCILAGEFGDHHLWMLFAGGDSHRRHEGDVPGRWHAHSSGQSVQRQQSAGQCAERVPQSERRSGDFRAAQ